MASWSNRSSGQRTWRVDVEFRDGRDEGERRPLVRSLRGSRERARAFAPRRRDDSAK
jgi:hypothetical protein